MTNDKNKTELCWYYKNGKCFDKGRFIYDVVPKKGDIILFAGKKWEPIKHIIESVIIKECGVIEIHVRDFTKMDQIISKIKKLWPTSRKV